MSKFRPQISEDKLRYVDRATKIGGFANQTEFVNAAVMIAYRQIVAQQQEKAGDWEEVNSSKVEEIAKEMQSRQLGE